MAQFEEPQTFKDRARDLFHRGNRRHVVVEKGDHRVVYLPLTVVILAALLAVWLVAILAVIAVVNGYSITLEPDSIGSPGSPPEAPPAPPPPPMETPLGVPPTDAPPSP